MDVLNESESFAFCLYASNPKGRLGPQNKEIYNVSIDIMSISGFVYESTRLSGNRPSNQGTFQPFDGGYCRHGKENIPYAPTIFVMNHLTRVKTIYYLYLLVFKRWCHLQVYLEKLFKKS